MSLLLLPLKIILIGLDFAVSPWNSCSFVSWGISAHFFTDHFIDFWMGKCVLEILHQRADAFCAGGR